MNIIPLRNLFVLDNNPCKELDLSSKILLYSLLTSHAIRIDTRLYLYDKYKDIIYFFNGYELRHLYAQEKSLQGFSKKIFCENKLYPGVRIYPPSIFTTILPRQDLYVVEHRAIDTTQTYRTINRVITSIGIIDQKIYELYKDYIDEKHVYLEDDHEIIFINKAHYILDIYFGGWIRRYGRIQRTERFK